MEVKLNSPSCEPLPAVLLVVHCSMYKLLLSLETNINLPVLVTIISPETCLPAANGNNVLSVLSERL